VVGGRTVRAGSQEAQEHDAPDSGVARGGAHRPRPVDVHGAVGLPRPGFGEDADKVDHGVRSRNRGGDAVVVEHVRSDGEASLDR
jgi:hypothetical protein